MAALCLTSFQRDYIPVHGPRTAFPVQEEVSATVTMDNWYAFDGTAIFDGTRKFNAQIVQEEF